MANGVKHSSVKRKGIYRQFLKSGIGEDIHTAVHIKIKVTAFRNEFRVVVLMKPSLH